MSWDGQRNYDGADEVVDNSNVADKRASENDTKSQRVSSGSTVETQDDGAVTKSEIKLRLSLDPSRSSFDLPSWSLCTS